MREIKYQGWYYPGNKMVTWDELIKSPFMLASFMGNELIMTYPTQPMWGRRQYTGLKDKNGREIYEGDIVQHTFFDKNPSEFPHGVIVWEDFYWAVRWGKDKEAHLRVPFETHEVIGNIYENGDLINV